MCRADGLQIVSSYRFGFCALACGLNSAELMSLC